MSLRTSEEREAMAFSNVTKYRDSPSFLSFIKFINIITDSYFICKYPFLCEK